MGVVLLVFSRYICGTNGTSRLGGRDGFICGHAALVLCDSWGFVLCILALVYQLTKSPNRVRTRPGKTRTACARSGKRWTGSGSGSEEGSGQVEVGQAVGSVMPSIPVLKIATIFLFWEWGVKGLFEQKFYGGAE